MSDNNIEENIDESIADKAFSIKDKILGSEAVKIGIAVFFLLTAVLFVAPFSFDNSGLKFKISQKISQIFQTNFIINGDVEIALIPVPTITAYDVLLQNYSKKSANDNLGKIHNFYAKSVKLKLPVFKTSNDSFAKKIIIKGAVIESRDHRIESIKDSKFNEIAKRINESSSIQEDKSSSGISSKIFSVDDLSASDFIAINLPTIIIKDSEFISYDQFLRKKDFKDIDAEILVEDDAIYSEGEFLSGDIKTDFKLETEFGSDSGDLASSLSLSSPVFILNINGDFTSKDKKFFSNNFEGKLEAEISEIKSFYGSYIGEGVVFQKLKTNPSPIKVSANITSSEQEVAVRNFLITSSLLNGKGEVDISLANHIPLIDIILNLENLDLDSLWSSEAINISGIQDSKAEKKEEKKKDETPKLDNPLQALNTIPLANIPEVDKSNIDKSKIIVQSKEEEAKEAVEENEKILSATNFDFTREIKDFDLTAEVVINNVKYLQGEIKDVNLYSTISREGEIMVLPMIFKIPGEGMVRVNGVLDSGASVPKFVGKFDVIGKNLKDVFKWFKVEIQNLKFDNLKEYLVYSDLLLLPNSISLDNFYLNLDNEKSEFLGSIKIDNSEKISHIISDFDINNFDIDDYFLTSGQNIYLSPGLLLKKLLWLNEISSSNDFNLNFDRLLYKGQQFDNQSLKLSFGRGYFSISDLVLSSEKTNLKADLAVDISDKNPLFKMNVVADNFYYHNQDFSHIKTSRSKKKNFNFIDQFYALPSLEGFRGNVNLDFKELEIDDFNAKNFKLKGRLKDGNLESTNLSVDLYDGNFEFKGLIGIRVNKIINGTYTFNNVSLEPLLSDLIGINSISGVVNIAANITSAASKKENFSKTLSSEIKFSANSPVVKGYGLNDLVKKMFAASIYSKELKDPEKILFNPDAITMFKQADGSIQINDGKDGRIRVNVTAPAVNGILSGTISTQKKSYETLFNAIFLTGNKKKQTPINIATSIKINSSGISHSTNIDQVRQYLGLSKSDPIVRITRFEKEIEDEVQVEEKEETINQEEKNMINQDNQIEKSTDSNQKKDLESVPTDIEVPLQTIQ